VLPEIITREIRAAIASGVMGCVNKEAVVAFTELANRRRPAGWLFVSMDGERLRGYKHWFVHHRTHGSMGVVADV
jgi:hypothetical protein